MARNVFESNEINPDKDAEILGEDPHILLPPLAEGREYEITCLPNGRSAVRVKSEDLQSDNID